MHKVDNFTPPFFWGGLKKGNKMKFQLDDEALLMLKRTYNLIKVTRKAQTRKVMLDATLRMINNADEVLEEMTDKELTILDREIADFLYSRFINNECF